MKEDSPLEARGRDARKCPINIEDLGSLKEGQLVRRAPPENEVFPCPLQLSQGQVYQEGFTVSHHLKPVQYSSLLQSGSCSQGTGKSHQTDTAEPSAEGFLLREVD